MINRDLLSEAVVMPVSVNHFFVRLSTIIVAWDETIGVWRASSQGASTGHVGAPFHASASCLPAPKEARINK